MPLSTDQQNQLLALAADGTICSQDVVTLRQAIFPDGVVDRSELEMVFAIGARAGAINGQTDPVWPELFAEVCVDFFLNEEQPEGYLTDEEFNYLQALVTRGGQQASALELQALAQLMTRARHIPAAMGSFIRAQLVAMIATRPDPSVQMADLPLISSVIYAGSGANALGISRQEADFLFDLHAATSKADNADGWRELFVKAICAHLTQHVGYKPVEREEALRRQAWLDDTSVQPGRFYTSMISGGLKAIKDALVREDEFTLRNKTDAAATQAAQRVCAEEALWLNERIAADGVVDDAERAVIVYLRDHLGAALPDRLARLLDSPPAHAAA